MGSACQRAEVQEQKPPARDEPKPKDQKQSNNTKDEKIRDDKVDTAKKASDPMYTAQMTQLEPLFCNISIGRYKNCYCCCVKTKDELGLQFGCVLESQEVYAATFSEAEMQIKKEVARLDWNKLFASIKTGFLSRRVTSRDANPTAQLSLMVPVLEKSSKPLVLTLKGNGNSAVLLHSLFLEPLCTYASKKRATNDDEKVRKVEQEIIAKRAAQAEHQRQVQALQAEVEPLRNTAKTAQEVAREARESCELAQKKINKLKNPHKYEDLLYPDGASKFLLHTIHAKDHIPALIQPNLGVLHLIKQKYNGDTSNPPAEVDTQLSKDVLQTLEKIDEWDFDVFSLQQQTNGASLFVTTYALLYKYGLVQHYKMNEQVLVNFLQVVEAGYHPNPYHNSTHAADVLQVTHYIIEPGGMAKAINMTKEDMLGALLSAAVHDYDHPGFNNNFHCRTQAYLATLYNDRSVLENHHIAQVFELMKNPKYNVLADLVEDKRKDVRDTMIEMVLSTDMGNHAKIFQAFRKRLSEDQEWVRKEDQRLAMAIAIKMADISNCGRPQQLYLEWAKKIAEEFYCQGDVENKLKFTISPFMDRRRDKTDFPKGQISFMNYIVIPLFESGAQFLTDLEFTVGKIQQNKEYWQNKQEDD